jgi:cytochrome c-type biogenesis protein CcmH
MSQWLLVIILAACGAGFVVFPILRTRQTGEPLNSPLETHKERLRKLERDVSSGEIAAEEANKERVTIEHGIAAIVCSNPVQAPISRRRNDLVAAGMIGAVVLAGVVGLYLATGQSANMVQSQEFFAANGLAPTQPKLPDVDTMIARVAERIKTNPDNAEDWRMLGWSYFETQRYTEAADAYSHAVALQPESATLQSAFGEAQVLAAGGNVTPEAMKAFAAALKDAPDDERALHFSGVAKSQKGDPKGAIAIWIAALKNTKPESLWAPRLRAEINETAKVASIDVSPQLPAAAPMSEEKIAEPAGRAVQQAQSMSPEEQQSMIKTMVAGLDERLARNPRDREGWVRLIRSRKVLGEPDQARAALDRALVAFRDDPTTQIELRTAALELGISSADR